MALMALAEKTKISAMRIIFAARIGFWKHQQLFKDWYKPNCLKIKIDGRARLLSPSDDPIYLSLQAFQLSRGVEIYSRSHGYHQHQDQGNEPVVALGRLHIDALALLR
jgi:hypothetical protein